MPWVIDAEDDGTQEFLYGGLDIFGREILSDHEVLNQPPGLQFRKPTPDGVPTIIDTENMVPFLHAEFEYGRAFYYLKDKNWRLNVRAKSDWYCDRFKRTLERMEPEKHRFVPIDIRMPDKITPWPERYWYWRCNNFLDAIIPTIGDGDENRSSNIWWNKEKNCFTWENGVPRSADIISIDRPVLNKQSIIGNHAWRDNGYINKYFGSAIFLSDQFVEELKKIVSEKGLMLSYVKTSNVQISKNI